MLQMRIAVSREQIAQRAGVLLAHTYVPILEQYTFSTSKYFSCIFVYFVQNTFHRRPRGFEPF